MILQLKHFDIDWAKFKIIIWYEDIEVIDVEEKKEVMKTNTLVDLELANFLTKDNNLNIYKVVVVEKHN